MKKTYESSIPPSVAVLTPSSLHPSLPHSLPPSPSSPDIKMEINTFTATFPKSNEHNKRFPSFRTGAIFLAQRRDSGSPASMTISRPILSRPINPRVRPANKPGRGGGRQGGREGGREAGHNKAGERLFRRAREGWARVSRH